MLTGSAGSAVHPQATSHDAGPPGQVAPRRSSWRRWALLSAALFAIYAVYYCTYGAEMHYHRARAAWGAYQYETAAKEARAALAFRPRMGKAHHLLGLALLSLGQPAAAVAPLERAVALRPNVAEWHTDLGIGYEAVGRTSDAVAQHKLSLKLDPTRADAHSNLAMCYWREGEVAEAEQQYRLAMACDPGDGQVRMTYGVLLEETGRTEEARRLYEEVIGLTDSSRHYIGGPTNPGIGAALRLGRLCLKQNHPYEALWCFEQASRLFDGKSGKVRQAIEEGMTAALKALKAAAPPGQFLAPFPVPAPAATVPVS